MDGSSALQEVDPNLSITRKEYVMENVRVQDYISDFAEELLSQLDSDEERWGDTWRRLPREGQEERILDNIDRYRWQFENAGHPVPWLKVAGLALIGWIRENHPEVLLTGEENESTK